ncbi:MAG: hypothetical protein JXR42_05565 [Gammaproteobacteria bacterium]|nr:hypothetical protein [Gammaproteobacteria bacterium]
MSASSVIKKILVLIILVLLGFFAWHVHKFITTHKQKKLVTAAHHLPKVPIKSVKMVKKQTAEQAKPKTILKPAAVKPAKTKVTNLKQEPLLIVKKKPAPVKQQNLAIKHAVLNPSKSGLHEEVSKSMQQEKTVVPYLTNEKVKQAIEKEKKSRVIRRKHRIKPRSHKRPRRHYKPEKPISFSPTFTPQDMQF